VSRENMLSNKDPTHFHEIYMTLFFSCLQLELIKEEIACRKKTPWGDRSDYFKTLIWKISI